MSIQTFTYQVLEPKDNEWHTVDFNRFAVHFARTNLKLTPVDDTGHFGFSIDFGGNGGILRIAATTKGPVINYAPELKGD